MLHLERHHIDATKSDPPRARMTSTAAAEAQRESDLATEAALGERERDGRLTPSQIETLAEIRARRGIAPPAPIATVAPSIAAPPRPPIPAPVANTVEGWKAEYAADEKLQADFENAETYANYMDGVSTGRVRIFRGRSAEPAKAATTVNIVALRKQALADWKNTAGLQREFATAEAHANYEVAVAQGRVRIFRGPGNAA